MSDGVAASLRDVYEDLILVTPFANTLVTALEHEITVAATNLIETCTLRTLIKAVDNPRLTMAMVDMLVGDHGRSVWSRDLGAVCANSKEVRTKPALAQSVEEDGDGEGGGQEIPGHFQWRRR